VFGYERVFGYENVRLDGHVERRIVESEAAVVRRIFELSVAGYGLHRGLYRGVIAWNRTRKRDR
jgi:hypothetical protein